MPVGQHRLSADLPVTPDSTEFAWPLSAVCSERPGNSATTRAMRRYLRLRSMKPTRRDSARLWCQLWCQRRGSEGTRGEPDARGPHRPHRPSETERSMLAGAIRVPSRMDTCDRGRTSQQAAVGTTQRIDEPCAEQSRRQRLPLGAFARSQEVPIDRIHCDIEQPNCLFEGDSPKRKRIRLDPAVQELNRKRVPLNFAGWLANELI